MIPKGLFSQIMLTVLSVLIIMTYIKPSLGDMKSIQDQIATYEQEKEKVATVNQKLATLKSTVNTIPEDDRRRLLTYMPNVVDTIAIPRDISAIAEEAGVIVSGIRYDGPMSGPVGEIITIDTDAPAGHVFSLTMQGSYGQLKQVFTAFEQNAYPLEVRELSINRQEGGFLQATMKIQTYHRQLPTPVVVDPSVPPVF